VCADIVSDISLNDDVSPSLTGFSNWCRFYETASAVIYGQNFEKRPIETF
jgi:hypothetical protein